MLLYLPILDIYVQKKISIIVHVKLAKFIMTIFFPDYLLYPCPFSGNYAISDSYSVPLDK